MSEDPGHEPDHKAGIQFHTLESRMDYMGSSVLMGRISNVSMKLSDEWKLDCIKRGHQPAYQRLMRSKRYDCDIADGLVTWAFNYGRNFLNL